MNHISILFTMTFGFFICSFYYERYKNKKRGYKINFYYRWWQTILSLLCLLGVVGLALLGKKLGAL